MQRKRTLLEKYNIPIYHLDFAYVNECSDARELEKIVTVLRSGEEGHYPDLIKCAENRLHLINPNSKVLRVEEPVRLSSSLDPTELQPILEWTKDIKLKDEVLSSSVKKEYNYPPVRKSVQIMNNKDYVEMKTALKDSKKVANRIKSMDYAEWEKYDDEVEILRMELEEERNKEEVERMNRINSELSEATPLISDIAKDIYREEEMLKMMSIVEREKLAEEYKIRGNDYFRSKEYNKAIIEYDRSLKINSTGQLAATTFNNRSITNIKMKKFKEAVIDCNNCLAIEPTNMKAHLRLAQSYHNLGQFEEAYVVYMKVLTVEPKNSIAQKGAATTSPENNEGGKVSGTRIKIQEGSSGSQKAIKTLKKGKAAQEPSTKDIPRKIKNTKITEISTTSGIVKNTENVTVVDRTVKYTTPLKKEYDLTELVKPSRVVPNKILNAAETFGKMAVNSQIENDNSEKTSEVRVSEPLDPDELKQSGSIKTNSFKMTPSKFK